MDFKKLLKIGLGGFVLWKIFSSNKTKQSLSNSRETTNTKYPDNGTNTITVVPPNIIPTVPIDFNIRCYQTVREGGIKFRFEAISKINGEVLDGVTWTYENQNQLVGMTVNGNYVVGLNNNGGVTSINVTGSRAGISKTRNFWGNTGNHDGQSITCDDNLNGLIVSNYSPQNGSQITLTYQGSLLLQYGQVLNWYGDSFTEISKTNNTITIQINQFPFWIQAQPTPVPQNNYCHGWTGIFFS